MAHTFDIRFARAAGLAAILAAPANSFRWTGSGRLSIDAEGISVALKRGLSSLQIRNRTRRIPAADLKDVFREGDSLRVEFTAGKSARGWLQFWANDRDTAAQIVSLLPTTRTFELEESAKGGKAQVNRRVTVSVVALLIAAIAGVFALRPRIDRSVAVDTNSIAQTAVPATPTDRAVEAKAGTPRSPGTAAPASVPAADTSISARPREIVIPVYPDRSAPSSAPTLEQRAAATDVPAAYTSLAERDTTSSLMREQAAQTPPLVFTVRVSPDGIVPIVPGMSAYEAALKELQIFLNAGERSSWWELTVHVHNDAAFDDPALWPLRDAELAASRAWRSYSDAIGHPDAAGEREFAQLMTHRVYQYVRSN